ncbi:T-complex protein 1 subunit epsilon, putative [Entamoeba invadens IP1]|uniref:T-complex protein 1 subunit epsilon n=2 Tax=Entamoeba invadens TaxID=33085 RepID=A0A0A1UFI0_ENTIV|nr:T-complex protein 1 subunit epsilon, putative [Entamoeba invadens IP1]ELP92684.1 T-complex protein 1 subunit epsilon, putative [Entamoeba invadens IP1]BAN41120.1 T-complex protein 1 subunit epsilon, putative [Entamoeba invadens]|eukprot:XP_004259455.1 T-complex protein 1 subunit epsilon, putative [Entamoeba invadens IP1]
MFAFDENGRPFIIVREQEEKKENRLRGVEATRAHILAAKTVSDILKTSLGPKGMDKMMVSQDGDVTVSNDGATIMQEMSIDHPIAKLLVELSQSQDSEIGDGTTGVVVFAGSLLEHSLKLVERGIHPTRIAIGYEQAAQVAVDELKRIAIPKEKMDRDAIVAACEVALGSKIVNRCKRHLAEVCTDAVLAVYDKERNDVNMDLIKLQTKAGGQMEDTELVQGLMLEKEFSHSQMKKSVEDAKVCILSCPFEPPKTKTTTNMNVTSVEAYNQLYQQEQDYFRMQVQRVKDAGANVVLCQWGFDDEANHLLLSNGINAVRWVGGVELELLAIATGARIVPRFEELTADKLGSCKLVHEMSFGTTKEKMIKVEGCPNSNAVTIFIRGGNKMVLAEIERSIHDALCVARNYLRDGREVCGGGSAEIAMSLVVAEAAKKCTTVEHHAMSVYADALLSIPHALAENSGLNAIETVAQVKQMQIAEKSSVYGIDCLQLGTTDMTKQKVFESLHSKTQQILLATQVVKMILKVDDVIGAAGQQR